MAEAGAVPGYGFGAQATARSPLGLEDLDLLKQTVLFTEEDEEYLRLAGDVLEDHRSMRSWISGMASSGLTRT